MLALAPANQPVTEDLEAAAFQRAVKGDEKALTWLYQRHASHIAGVVRRSLGHDAEVDDIVQETFVQGLGQLAALREPAKLRAFLVTIAVRRIYARLSLRYRFAALASQLLRLTVATSNPEVAERVQVLKDELASVRPRHRVAWILHRVEGHTLPEVAAHTGASLTTVKRWISEVDKHLEETDAP